MAHTVALTGKRSYTTAAAERVSWKRFLLFQNPEVECEFAVELRDKRQSATVVIMAATALLYMLKFLIFGDFGRVSDSHIASRVVCLVQAATFSVLVLLGVATWMCATDLEAVTITYLIVVSVSLFSSNRFRVSRVFGGDLYEESIAGCEAAVCYDDTLLVVALAACTTLTIIFAPLRAAKSWVLVVVTTLLYFLSSSFGLGPVRAADTMKIGTGYALWVCMIWLRSFTHERDFRRQWLGNRDLRLEVDRQRRLCEEQQRWLDEVNERLEAMHMRSPASSQDTSDLAVDTAKYLVPGRGSFAVREAHPHASVAEPNALLAQLMAGRRAEVQLVKRMAKRIREPAYAIREFFEDCIAAFPELELFHAVEGVVCGASFGPNYQRTFGALFAVYWLVRLDIDGMLGLSFGCDEAWRVRTEPAGVQRERKERFYEGMDWASLRRVVDVALGDSLERIEAILCLTAIHDIMRMPELLPRVSPDHSPYRGYGARDRILDKHEALAYTLEHFPHLLPSFACLQRHMQDVVLFTQTKMSFDQGLFVQAEGPPGTVLSELKQVLHLASRADLAFYFVRWLADMAGADGTPLAGAEKLTRHFPLSMLVAFLWSMPHLLRLAERSETKVMEAYLVARFQQSRLGEPPVGPGAVAAMRLAAMAHTSARLVVEAFWEGPAAVRDVLGEEMALTGIAGQMFHGCSVVGGPAFFVCHGSALLQRCSSPAEMSRGLHALASIYAAARRLWPREVEHQGDAVTLELGQLLATRHGSAIFSNVPVGAQVWALVRRGDRRAELELLAASAINSLMARGDAFDCVDLRPAPTQGPEGLEDLACATVSVCEP